MKKFFALFAIAVAIRALPGAAQTCPTSANWCSGTYLYDGMGNIRAIGSDTYIYDTVGRLVSGTAEVQRGGTSRQDYGYDAFGNRTSASRITGSVDCLGGCEQSPSIDPVTNHITGNSAVYDAAGNLIWITNTAGGTSFTSSYEYDAAGSMSRASAGSDIRQFIYTADDERIATRSGQSWTWTVRGPDNKVLREFTSTEPNGQPGLPTTGRAWLKDYVWRDGLLLASVTTGTSGSITQHYHLDHIGTPRVISNDAGVQTSLHAYYAFGAELNLGTEPAPGELLKFTGHERDLLASNPNTLDYMHARFEMETMGRFLSVDPGPVDPERPQSWNRYSYVSNNPLVYSDPDGREQRFNPTTYNWKGLLTSLDRAVAFLHTAGKVLDKTLPVAFDVIVVGEMIVKFADTGEGMQPAVEQLEADVDVAVQEAETEGTVLFRGGSSIQARDSELKIINGEVQPQRGPSLNTDPAKVSSHGEPHRIESAPEGLTIKQIGRPGHHEIIPTAPMSKIAFQQLLDQIIRTPF